MHGLAYACRLNSCVRRPVLACMMPLPRTLIFVCFVSTFTCLFRVASFSYILSPITACPSFNMFVYYHMFRLGFYACFLLRCHEHAFTCPFMMPRC